MKIIRFGLLGIAVLAALALNALPSVAQHAGFQIGIAPSVNPPLVIPGFSQPIVMPFTTAPVAPFTVAPVTPFMVVPATVGFPPTQAPLIVTRPGFQPHHPHRRFTRVPPGCCVSHTPQVIGPGQVILPGAVIVNVPQAHFGPPIAPVMPPIGTPRAHVLRQFGHPTVAVITSRGETLYFNGGVTVIIQNGQVAGPK